jgi:hypothetical protein
MAKVETEKRKGRIWQLGKEDLSLEDARQLKRHIINVDDNLAKRLGVRSGKCRTQK